MQVDPEVMRRHYAAIEAARDKALVLIKSGTKVGCPVEFAVKKGLPIWAVQNALIKRGMMHRIEAI